MAGVKWIKICTDIFDDEKVVLIESMPDADGIIVIWFKLLCLAGKQNNGGVFMLNDKIAYTDDMLAHIFRRPLTTVRLALKTFEDFGMIEIVDNVVTIPKWEKHPSLDVLEKARETNRKKIANYRAKQKRIAAGDCNGYSNGYSNGYGNGYSNGYGNVTDTLQTRYCNADVTGIDKEEDKDISHESHACACEEKTENGGLTAFLTAHPTIKNDLASEIPLNIDWAALGRAIAESEWLQQCTSLRWLIENYDKIIGGAYKTFKTGKTQHFEAERKYTAEELNKLYKNVDDIDF